MDQTTGLQEVVVKLLDQVIRRHTRESKPPDQFSRLQAQETKLPDQAIQPRNLERGLLIPGSKHQVRQGLHPVPVEVGITPKSHKMVMDYENGGRIFSPLFVFCNCH